VVFAGESLFLRILNFTHVDSDDVENNHLMQDLGALLRERREALGLNLADVEAGTRIRQKYLAALESDEWHLLPGEVVGRGFLRNYTRFLDLDADAVLERRKVSVDPHLQRALESTSAGAPMPAGRDVDYRPRDVSLTREPLIDFDDIVIDWRRFTPLISLLLLVLVLAGGWWGVRQLSPRMGDFFGGAVGGVQTRVAEIRATEPATAIPAGLVVSDAGNTAAPEATATPVAAAVVPVVEPTATPIPPTPAPSPTPTVFEPTATPADSSGVTQPVVEEPTAEVVVETPTEEAAPPPEFPSPVCADERSVLLSPGVNQLVQGQVTISGTVFHDDFWYYKLEFAPGANASEGFVYFAGAERQITGGELARLNSAALGNGTYTLKLTVVDNAGNFPPTCQVTIRVEN